MSITKGRAFLLKVSDGATEPNFFSVAGLRETGFIAAGDAVAVTGVGIFLGSAGEATIRGRALDGSEHDYELSYEGGEKLRGRLQVQRLAYTGDFNGERNFELTLMGTARVVANLEQAA